MAFSIPDEDQNEMNAIVRGGVRPSSNEVYDRDEAFGGRMRFSGNQYLHPKSFIIHSDYSKYIPLGYICHNMFEFNFAEGKLTDPYIMPIKTREAYDETNYFLRMSLAPDHNFNHPFLHAKSNDGLYFNNGLILDDEGIVFCCGVETEHIKQAYITSLEELKENEFYKLAIEKGVSEKESVKSLLKGRVYKHTTSILRSSQTNDKIKLFINEDKYFNWMDRLGLNRLEQVLEDSTWSQAEIVSDNITNWFNSQVFVQPEVPVFSDIDGPEKFAQEAIEEYDMVASDTANF